MVELFDNHIQYVEFKAKEIQAIKSFYSRCFNWKFTDYGPNYVSFEDSGLM